MGGIARALTVAGSVVLFLFGSYPRVVAAQREQPPLFFASGVDGELEISKSQDVELVSNFDEPVVATLSVRLPDLPSKKAEPVAGSSVLLVPGLVRVPAGQKVDVPLVVRGLEEVEPGVQRRGEITATVGNYQARLSVLVTAPEPAATTPTFAASEWTVTKVRRLGVDGLKGVMVPLAPVKDGAELPEILGVIQDGDGDPLPVAGELDGDTDSIKLNIEELELHPGTTYAGTLDLEPGKEEPGEEESGTLALTVRSTDDTWPAVAMMVAGVLIGVLIAWVTSVWWRVHALQDAKKQAREIFEKRQKEFEEEPSRPKPANGATWRLKDDVAANPRDLYRPIRLAIDPTDGRLADIEKGIARLKLAEQWGAPAAEELGALQAAVTAFSPPSAPTGLVDKPGVLDAAKEHLAPEPPAEEVALEGIESFRDRSVWLTTTLEVFLDMWAKTEERLNVLQRFQQDRLSWDEQRLVRDGLSDLRAARWYVWHAQSPDELVAGKVEQRLAAADDAIAKVAEAHPPAAEERQYWRLQPGQQAQGAGTVLGTIDFQGLLSSVSDALDGSFERVLRIGRSVLHPFSLFLVLAVAIALAVLTGLPTVYGDGPWGTFGDYVAALAWGIGAVVVIKAVDTTLGSFWGIPAPMSEPATVAKTPVTNGTA